MAIKAPTIYNVTLTSADTEYSQVFPDGTRGVSFQARNRADVRFSYESGKVAAPTAPYATLFAETTFEENTLLLGATLYLASSTAGTVVEIIAWS